MFILRRIYVGIFKSLVKILGGGSRTNQRHRNWYRSPFHWNLTYFCVSGCRGMLKQVYWRSIFTIRLFCLRRQFSWFRSSILKCEYGMNVFNFLQFMIGQKRPSFFGTRKMLLINWSFDPQAGVIAPFLIISWRSLFFVLSSLPFFFFDLLHFFLNLMSWIWKMFLVWLYCFMAS